MTITTLLDQLTERERAIIDAAIAGMYHANDVPEGERDIYSDQRTGAYGSFHDALERMAVARGISTVEFDQVRNVLWDHVTGPDNGFEQLRAAAQHVARYEERTRTYYTLLVREATNLCWDAEFGDYQRSVVREERDEIRDKYPPGCTRIIETTHQQADIDATIAEMNRLQDRG